MAVLPFGEFSFIDLLYFSKKRSLRFVRKRGKVDRPRRQKVQSGAHMKEICTESKKKNHPVRFIAMDMDGTLLNSNKEIDEKTRDQLIRIQKQGVKLALASGRPTKGLEKFARELRLDEFGGYLISNNGGKVHRADDQSVIYEHPLTIDETRRVLEHLRQFEVIPMVESGEYMLVNNVFDNQVTSSDKTFNVIDYEAHSNGFLLKESRDIASDLENAPIKILTAGSEDYLKKKWKAMQEPFVNELDSMFTSPFYFEFTAKNTNKGSALAALPFKKEEIVVIGDAQNDLPMFEKAGIRLAMGNAAKELKEQADEVIGDNDHEGIGRWIEANI